MLCSSCDTAIAGVLESFGLLRTHGVVRNRSLCLQTRALVYDVFVHSMSYLSIIRQLHASHVVICRMILHVEAIGESSRDDPDPESSLFVLIGCTRSARGAEWSRLLESKWRALPAST